MDCAVSFRVSGGKGLGEERRLGGRTRGALLRPPYQKNVLVPSSYTSDSVLRRLPCVVVEAVVVVGAAAAPGVAPLQRRGETSATGGEAPLGSDSGGCSSSSRAAFPEPPP